MATDEQYKWLAEQVYWVEQKRDDVQYHPISDSHYPFDPKNPQLGQFQVLKVKDNTENGMQAMAVAPVDKNGKVDYSEVVIVYSGINIAL